MVIKYPLSPGIYSIDWENQTSSTKKTSEILLEHVNTETDLMDFLKKKLNSFDRLTGDNPINLLRGSHHDNRQIAIVSITDEYSINDLLDNGYTIREFHQGSCILQQKRNI